MILHLAHLMSLPTHFTNLLDSPIFDFHSSITMLCNCMIVCDNNDGRVEVSSDSVKQLDDCPTRL